MGVRRRGHPFAPTVAVGQTISVTPQNGQVHERIRFCGLEAETAESTEHAEITRWIMRMRAEGVIFVGQHVDSGLAA
jgi:hypothetical protein